METKIGFISKKCVAIAGTIGLLYAMFPSVCAYAAEEEVHGSASDLVPYWINFLLYVGLLVFVLRKAVPQAWEARKQTIATLVNRGKVERAAADQALQNAKSKALNMKAEMTTLTAQIKKESAAEVEEVLRDAKEKAQRSRFQGKDMLSAEEKAFELSLKRELAEEVIKRATENLQREMTVEKDAPLRNSAVQEIGELIH